MKFTSLMLLLAVVCLCTAGCETMKGLGRDIENTGSNIQDLFTKNNL